MPSSARTSRPDGGGSAGMPLGTKTAVSGSIFSSSIMRRRSSRETATNALLPRAISSRSMIVFARPSNDQPCSWVTTTGTPQSRPNTTPQMLEPNLWAWITSTRSLRSSRTSGRQAQTCARVLPVEAEEPDAGAAQRGCGILDGVLLALERGETGRAHHALEARRVEALGDLHREMLGAAMRTDPVGELQDLQTAAVTVPRRGGAVRGIRQRIQLFEGVRHSGGAKRERGRVEGKLRGTSDISCISLPLRATEIGS